jgi:hypothetical protein
MQYKTIALELLKHHRGTYNQLRKNRALLATMELLAKELRTRHEMWKDSLSEARPGINKSQIASEALELALTELKGSLDSASRSESGEPLSLDAAMTFIRTRTLPQ